MPSEIRSPRTLSNWTEFDYYRRRRLMSAWWWFVGGSAMLGGLLVVGMWGFAGNQAFQAGPLSPPHATFNNDCSQCHEKAFTTVTRLWAGDGVGTVTDDACKKCHNGADHTGHHVVIGRCVSCHKEHKGHDRLVRVDDSKCVQCHRDLSNHAGPEAFRDGKGDGWPEVFNTMTAFAPGKHEPFREKEDTGTIKFNHKTHLNPEGIPVRDLKQYEKQAEEYRKKGLDPAALPFGKSKMRKLECAECHQMDEAGRYMKPISYEQHCGECHPLGAQLAGPWGGDADMRKLASAFSRERISHPRKGQGPRQVRASLRDALTRFITQTKNVKFRQVVGIGAGRLLPDRDPAPAELNQAEFSWVNGQMQKIERTVFDGAGGCKYCHAPEKQERADGEFPAFLKSNIPERWWQRANFRHDSHRVYACSQCHKDVEQGRDTKDVLLPTMDNCLECHVKGEPKKARSNCMDCHSFHDPKQQKGQPPSAREK
jgi:hypothetical protein